jgi:hypothetical protein
MGFWGALFQPQPYDHMEVSEIPPQHATNGQVMSGHNERYRVIGPFEKADRLLG